MLTSVEARRADAQAQADQVPKECLLAEPFDDAQAATLRQALETTLSPGSWQINTVAVSARWIVYMGKFANADALTKKRGELTAMNLAPQTLNNPDLEPGLSLGGFVRQAADTAELSRLANQRGIRTAKVVLERQGGQQSQLKLPALSAEQKGRLNDVRPALGGRSLHACG